MVSALDRLTYAARQTARVAWYASHYAAGRRLLKPMPKPEFPIGPTPSRAELTPAARAQTRTGRVLAPQPALFPRLAARRCPPPRPKKRLAAGRAGRRPARVL